MNVHACLHTQLNEILTEDYKTRIMQSAHYLDNTNELQIFNCCRLKNKKIDHSIEKTCCFFH